MKLIEQLKGNPDLVASIEECKKQCKSILQRYLLNFPEYTDHSITHSEKILSHAENLIGNGHSLNPDEIYILIMACYLHDIGMASSEEVIKKLKESSEYKEYEKEKGDNFEDFLRGIHHKLSYDFILNNYETLGIINETYAEAIALVGMGHRKENLFDFDLFPPHYSVKSGSDFVCIPFLAGILRLADELDITNDRTPDLLFSKYFPKNKISKDEWNKHKATYRVNFRSNLIIINAKCDNPFLYNALVTHYKKIEQVINYVQKMIRNLPQGERSLSLNYSKLENKIKPIDFLPKNIGFSFDMQNTLDTFIGKNLYSDKFVAIREALQNSIDACNYKKKLNQLFVPEINVTLLEDKLIIEDNGNGMDEFIVENFFARLASSFYKQKKISKNYESISEFGIGIFSYFLMCDCFEVETKMDSENPLKFKVTKEANSNFFFYDNPEMQQSGTKITLLLNEKINFEDLKEKIQHYFRFVDVPITLKFKGREERVASQKFEIEKDALKKRINMIYEAKLDEFTIFSKRLNTDYYEGVVGIIIGKDKEGKFFPNELYYVIKDRYNGIDICQQGIYVNSQNSRVLSHLIGKINIKKKASLNLSRTQMKELNLQEIISDFEVEIIKEVFDSWKNLSLKNRASITNLFIERYLRYSGKFPENICDAIIGNFIVKSYDGEKISYCLLKDFMKDRFLIMKKSVPYTSGGSCTISDLSYVFQKFKLPILIVDEENGGFYLNLFRSMKLNVQIDSNGKNWFYIFDSNKRDFIEKMVLGRREALKFNNNQIISFPHISLSRKLNVNHPIIKYLLENERINENQELYELIDQFLETLTDFAFNFHNSGISNPKYYLDIMNKILERINALGNTNFKLSKEDFAPWISETF